MDRQLLTALLGICLCLARSVGLGEEDGVGEDEDEALLRSYNAPARGPSCVPESESCMVPDAELSALRYPEPKKQLELKLEFQPQRPQLLRSSADDVERLLRYGGNTLICTTENAKRVSYKRPAATAANEDDYDDGEDAAAGDDDDDDNNDDSGKEFTARVSCIMRTLCANTKSLSEDLRALNTALLPLKTSVPDRAHYVVKSKSAKKSDLKQPKNMEHVIDNLNDYLNADGPDADVEYGQKLKRISNQKQQLKPRAASVAGHRVKEIVEERLLQEPPNVKEAEVPFRMPTGRIIVPPLLQLLKRRSAPPSSVKGHNLFENRHYLRALNELRLVRAVHAATAARLRQQQSNPELQQNINDFRENLRRLVSNRAHIERRLSGLLTSLSHHVPP